MKVPQSVSVRLVIKQIAPTAGGTRTPNLLYLNMADTERAAVRARALRETAGTLSSHATETADEGTRDVLADVLAVFGSDAELQWGDLAGRLASRFPGRWDGASGDAVSAECRADRVPSVKVSGSGGQAKGCRRADVEPLAGAR